MYNQHENLGNLHNGDRLHSCGRLTGQPLIEQTALPDLLCLSDLRWDSLKHRQRSQLILWARKGRVFFFEEPMLQTQDEKNASPDGSLLVRQHGSGVVVATPHLPAHLLLIHGSAAQRRTLDKLVSDYAIQEPLLWYNTPWALPYASHVRSCGVVHHYGKDFSGLLGAIAQSCRAAASHADGGCRN